MQQGKRGSRIRQGTPQEEQALASHLQRLAPTPSRASEAGQLAEVLVLLGRVDAAAALQHTLSDLVKQQAAAAAWLAANPPPERAAADAKPPADRSNDWKWAILRPRAAQSLDGGGVVENT